jgi:pilus assembly protein FimV
MSDFAVSSMEGIQTEINEVDPLSEADVYLAYGRYKQAEELITQAIEKNPQRAELKMKLLEIHYAAKDHEAFELQAELVRDSFSTQHPELWARVMEMGRELAPDSALFGGSGVAAAPTMARGAGDEFDLGDLNLGDEAVAQADAGDFSLDFDLDSEAAPTTAAKPKPAKAEAADENMLDFDLGDLKLNDEPEPVSARSPAADDRSLDFDLSAFDTEKAMADAPTDESVAAATDDNALDFDFSAFGKSDEKETEMALDAVPTADDVNALEIDLGDFEAEPAPKAAASAAKREANVVDFKSKPAVQLEEQPTFEGATEGGDIDGDLDEALFADVDEVGTKLDLAKAYIDMGDSDGARSILDEVMEEGDDTQKQEAQVLMRQIG